MEDRWREADSRACEVLTKMTLQCMTCWGEGRVSASRRGIVSIATHLVTPVRDLGLPEAEDPHAFVDLSVTHSDMDMSLPTLSTWRLA